MIMIYLFLRFIINFLTFLVLKKPKRVFIIDLNILVLTL